MFKRVSALLFGLTFVLGAYAQDQTWVEGKNYYQIEPAQPNIGSSDKIEVAEVFSYGCPACEKFRPTMAQLKKELPANVEVVYVPAALRKDEGWPLFQRSFFTAQALGLGDKSHDAMFDAIWKPDGPLSIAGKNNRPIERTLEDVANFFSEKFGVKAADFVATANSFAVNTRIKRADAYIRAVGIDSTPTIIVGGKYRLTGQSAGGWDKVTPLVLYLIQKD